MTIIFIKDQVLIDNVRSDLTDGTNWNQSKAIIDTITVSTSSTDWTLTLYCDRDETSGIYGSVVIADGVNGSKDFTLDMPYIDNYSGGVNKEVHVKFADNTGSNTATFSLYGIKAT